MNLINIGFGNIAVADRIVAIVTPESSPIKRAITEARDKGVLVDVTCGRRTRSAILTDNGSLILSALQPETLAARIEQGEKVTNG